MKRSWLVTRGTGRGRRGPAHLRNRCDNGHNRHWTVASVQAARLQHWAGGTFNPLVQGSTPWRPTRETCFWQAENELRNLRQLAWSTIAGGMSLVPAFFFGSSWYLAEKIRSEALAVGPGPAMPAYDDVQVVGLSPEQVQLRAVGDQAALFKPA